MNRPPVRPPVRRFELAGVRPAALVGMFIAVLIPVAVVAVLVIGVGGQVGWIEVAGNGGVGREREVAGAG